MNLPVRITGTQLPGARFGQYTDVHVGIQRGQETVALVPGDAVRAVFDLTITVAAGPDFRGDFVHGRRGERFLYLCWGELPPGGEFAMFRRAKLHLQVLDPAEVAAAAERGDRLDGALPLTDGRGGPLCASVRPPVITWDFRPSG